MGNSISPSRPTTTQTLDHPPQQWVHVVLLSSAVAPAPAAAAVMRMLVVVVVVAGGFSEMM